jgi:MarR family multiple antibiotic resistance transcriptional regulator
VACNAAGDAAFQTLFSDLVRCETRLYNALNDRLRARHGIVASQFEFLRFVRDHPGARVADIATGFAVGIGATSKGVDRLEERGLLVRRPNPGDRRSSLLELTATGRELTDAAQGTADQVLVDLVGGVVDEPALQVVGQVLARLRTALERGQVGMPVG